MTDTMMGLDIEAIEHLDFSFAPPCEMTRGEENICDKCAEWKLVIACCGNTYLMCDQHKVEQLDYVTKHGGNLKHEPRLGGCGAEGNIHYMEVSPLS